MTIMHKLLLAAACAAAAFTAGAASAQTYPTRPIKILVPYAPGGATDYAARLVTEKVKIILGQNIVIENRTGAGGIIALEEMARSKPDGYTLMIGNVSTNAITPVLFPTRMTIDYDKDVVPIARLLVTPSVLTVNADYPPRTLQQFVDDAKKNPGKVRYASTGIGSFVHFDMEMLARKLGLDLIHIPYKGGAGDAIKGLVSGDVNVGSTNAVLGLSLSKAGKIAILATNMPQRIKQLPDAPTFAELGHPGQGTLNWSMVFAPAGVPAEVITTLHKAFTDAVKDRGIMEAAEKTGTFGYTLDSQAETAAFLKDEMAKWRKTVSEIKIELN